MSSRQVVGRSSTMLQAPAAPRSSAATVAAAASEWWIRASVPHCPVGIGKARLRIDARNGDPSSLFVPNVRLPSNGSA